MMRTKDYIHVHVRIYQIKHSDKLTAEVIYNSCSILLGGDVDVRKMVAHFNRFLRLVFLYFFLFERERVVRDDNTAGAP